MVDYTEEQLEIARSLMNEPKTIEELREETDMNAQELNQELKEMINLDVVEMKEDKYKLIEYIEQQTGAKEIEGKYLIRMMIEGSSKSEQAVESEMDKLEQRLKQEPYKITSFERGDPELDSEEENYSAFIETEVSAPKLSHLVHLIMNYGPSSVEILEPDAAEVKIDELQKTLNNLASGVHYYISLILQLRQQLDKSQLQSQQMNEPQNLNPMNAK